MSRSIQIMRTGSQALLSGPELHWPEGALLLGGELERVGFYSSELQKDQTERRTESGFGNNDHSWSLEINKGKCFAHHNNEKTSVCDWLSSSAPQGACPLVKGRRVLGQSGRVPGL
ncbi:hypothetical protein NL108_017188 [Boleophthalmus pectinirostris]|nr:hypothetical protein NL108_017188 [Boleophthalmus pectinirostris]